MFRFFKIKNLTVGKAEFIENDSVIYDAIKNMKKCYNKRLTKTENFFKQYAEKLGYKVEVSIDRICVGGIPDFIIGKDGIETYVEIKAFNSANGRSDGLRLSQIEWLFKNRVKEVWLLFIDLKEIEDIEKMMEVENNKISNMSVEEQCNKLIADNDRIFAKINKVSEEIIKNMKSIAEAKQPFYVKAFSKVKSFFTRK